MAPLYERPRSQVLDRALKRARARLGHRPAPGSVGGLRQLVRALRGGGLAAVLPDQVPVAAPRSGSGRQRGRHEPRRRRRRSHPEQYQWEYKRYRFPGRPEHLSVNGTGETRRLQWLNANIGTIQPRTTLLPCCAMPWTTHPPPNGLFVYPTQTDARLALEFLYSNDRGVFRRSTQGDLGGD